MSRTDAPAPGDTHTRVAMVGAHATRSTVGPVVSLGPTDAGEWSTDLTRLCLRLADRLWAGGAHHAGAAALAVTVRGAWGCSRHELSTEVGVDVDELARIEAGDVGLGDLPGGLMRAALSTAGLDLAACRSWRPAPDPNHAPTPR